VSIAAGLKAASQIEKETTTDAQRYYRMWERFLTAISWVIVAAPLEKQRDASRGYSHQPLTST
jgi:hypothetical protein